MKPWHVSGKQSIGKVHVCNIPYNGKVWQALNLANWLLVDIGKILIWRSVFLAPYIGAHASILASF